MIVNPRPTPLDVIQTQTLSIGWFVLRSYFSLEALVTDDLQTSGYAMIANIQGLDLQLRHGITPIAPDTLVSEVLLIHLSPLIPSRSP